MIEPNDLLTLPAHARVELINQGRREERERIVKVVEGLKVKDYPPSFGIECRCGYCPGCAERDGLAGGYREALGFILAALGESKA